MGDDEFQIGSGNWSQRSRSSRCSSPSSSSTYTWPTQVADVMKPVSTLLLNTINDSSNSNSSPAASSANLFHDSHKQPLHHQDNPNLHMMGLGLSSQPMDWNQHSLFRRSIEKSDESSSFRSMLQEDHDLSSNTTSFQQADQQQWPPRPQKMMMYSSSSADSDGVFSAQLMSSTQHQHHHMNPNSTIDQMDASLSIQYQNNPSTTSMLPGLLGYEINHHPQQPFDNRSAITNFNSYPTSYGMNSSSSSDHDQVQQLMLQPNSWQPISNNNNNKAPQNQLHLSNNAPFWNASAAAPIINHDVRSNFFPSLQMQSPSSTFDEKPKKSSSSETSNKRPRNETPSSPMPAKARKEKMGDRITALQQLVSPFGKTDTASVLSEAIDYIKFLHEQVSVLSNAYVKSGAPIQQQQQQKCDKSKDPEGEKQDLRSRGLCLVPVSSTYPWPVTHETTVDFWNPTFGGTFR